MVQKGSVEVFNSLSPGDAILKILKNLNDNFCQHSFRIFCEIALGWMPIISRVNIGSGDG